MKRSLLITLLLLLGLTALSAILAHTGDGGRSTKFAIMLLASVKFYLVAFHFMDLRKAHPFWKGVAFFYMTVMTLLSLMA